MSGTFMPIYHGWLSQKRKSALCLQLNTYFWLKTNTVSSLASFSTNLPFAISA